MEVQEGIAKKNLKNVKVIKSAEKWLKYREFKKKAKMVIKNVN